MKRIFDCLSKRAIAAAILGCITLAATTARGQSPLFPNTSPIYSNPYGAPSSSPNGPFYRGQPFTLQRLPAVYNQPLPAPPPSVMAQFGGTPYNYGANSNVRTFGDANVRVFGGTDSYQPTRQRNWAPGYSSR